MVVTFTFVMLCWVPFRAASFGDTLEILRRLAGFDDGGGRWRPEIVLRCVAIIVLAHGLGLLIEADRRRRVFDLFDVDVVDAPLAGRSPRFGVATFAGAFAVTFWVLGLFYFAAVRTSPFIYFQF
jgi:hypothetical protein